MRFRTFAWLSAAVIVIAGNTAYLLWRRASLAPGPRGASSAWAPTRVPETPVPYLPVDPGTVERASTGEVQMMVHVFTGEGAPVSGARVRVTGDRPGTWSPFPVEALAEGLTGKEGMVDLRLPRRTGVRVRVECDGFAPKEVVPEWSATSVVLSPAGSLRVRLLDDATGAPLAGVAIRARHEDPERARPSDAVEGVTDDDGACVLRGPGEGTWRVFTIEPYRTIGEARVGGREEFLEVRLKRKFRLRGRVVAPGFDRPIGEGRVAASHNAPILRRFEAAAPVTVPLDAEGRFILDGFDGPPRSAVHVRVETGGRVHLVGCPAPVLDPATGEQVGEVQVAIPGNSPDGSFSGTVRDEAGRPVAGALVLLGAGLPSAAVRWMRSELWLHEAWTGADGAWRVVPQYSGVVFRQALILHPDHAPGLVELPTRMRARAFDVSLERGVSVVVSVRDASGRPVAGAEVSAQMRHPEPERAWQEFGDVHGAIHAWPRTGSDGVAVLTHLGLGSWYLVARSADGREGARALIEVRSGMKDLGVTMRLAPLPDVRGTIRVRGGSLPPGASVLVPGQSPMDFVQLPVSAKGAFQSPSLDIPACLLVDGRIPIFMPELTGPGDVIGLAEPGVPIEITVDAPQAR